MRSFYRFLLFLLLIIIHLTTFLKAQLVITSDKAESIYNSGETVKWTLQKDSTINLESVRYTVKKGGLSVVDQGQIEFINHQATVNYTLQIPGTILLDVRWDSEDSWRNKVVGGAVADPEKLKLSGPRPTDFDEFWESKLYELAEVPMNPILEKGEGGEKKVDYWKITMNNIRDSLIQGQMARPIKGKKVPALLIVQWTGVYPLQKS